MRLYLFTLLAAVVLVCNFPALAQSADTLTADNTVGGPYPRAMVQAAPVKVGTDKTPTTLQFQWDPKGQSGMLAIADIISYGGPFPVIAAPDGWNLIRDDADRLTTRQTLYWHVMDSDDPATLTWSFNQAVDAEGAIVLLENASTAAPIDATSGNIDNGWELTASSALTTTSGDLILSFDSSDFGASANYDGVIGPGQVFPDNVNTIVNQDWAEPYWILGAWQTTQGETGDIVSNGVQLGRWIASQVAVRR
ncbi:MAG TPA: hypothetical protein VMU16_01975 [Candidatus Binataceae bacterium]|nr:hypothetical protein [Candidatus Binataceae bacterium]